MTLKTTRVYPKNRLLAWIEGRLPLASFLAAHTSRYYAPKNFNVWYYFGVPACRCSQDCMGLVAAPSHL